MRLSESSDVPAMSHFKVLLKAHTVPRLLAGHKGEVYVGVSVRLKEGKTDTDTEGGRKRMSSEGSRSKLRKEMSPREKRGPLKQMFI